MRLNSFLSPLTFELILFLLRTLVRAQHTLAQADRLRRHFHQFIVGNEFKRLLERKLFDGHEPHRFVGARGAHVRQLLLLDDVDI